MNLPDLPFPVSTPRLVIKPISETDAAFILELLNSPTWLKYIGDRQIHSLSDAEKYIQGIQIKTNVRYYVVNHIALDFSIGLLTLMKREYLEFPDLGFAFLPEFTGQGFAFEATRAILANIRPFFQEVLAITIPDNFSSINLLNKLGFIFKEEIYNENEKILVYILKISN